MTMFDSYAKCSEINVLNERRFPTNREDGSEEVPVMSEYDALKNVASSMRQAGASIEFVLRVVRELGGNQIQSVKIVRQVENMNLGEAKIVWIDMAGGQSVPLPEALRSQLPEA